MFGYQLEVFISNSLRSEILNCLTGFGPSFWKQLLCAASGLNLNITLGPQESSVVHRQSTLVVNPIVAFGRRWAAVAGQGGTASALGQCYLVT